jgi:RNA polymerase sigma-70 factor (ECF subfamily)
MSMQQEPQAWLEDLRAGDMQALAQLFEYYRPRLERMLWSRMGQEVASRFDAADVLQEAYLDATQQISGYLRDARVDVYIWLRSLTWQRLFKFREQHVEAQRRSVRREAGPPATSSFITLVQLLAAGTSPSQAAVRGEVRAQLEAGLATLPEADREILVLRHYEDLTNHEAAQVLNISDSAATMRYGRALFRLKTQMLNELNQGGERT